MLGREFCRGLIVQCAVWPTLIVAPAPGGDQESRKHSMKRSMNAFCVGLAGKFRSLVGSNGLGIATEAGRLIENSRHVMP